MDDFNTSSGVVSPASLMTSIPSMSPEIDVKPHLKMEDFTKPHTADLLVRKPVKKRKSWGQQLPDPKTNLAPRKRAKTDDEKEQRRIERIKRNRAAAHNSRERKRVEAEHLANANDILVQRIQTLQRRLAEQDAQLEKCKELLPEGLPHVPEEEIAYDKDYFPDPESVSPVSSSFTFDPRASIDTSDSPTSPKVTVKLEEHDSPIIFSQVDSLSSGGPQGSGSLDPTQHSAVSVEPTIASVNIPSLELKEYDLDADKQFPVPTDAVDNPLPLHRSLQDLPPSDLDSLSYDQVPFNLTGISNFADLFDFDTSSSSLDAFPTTAATNPTTASASTAPTAFSSLDPATTHLVDLGAANLACDGSLQLGY